MEIVKVFKLFRPNIFKWKIKNVVKKLFVKNKIKWWIVIIYKFMKNNIYISDHAAGNEGLR